MTSPTSGLTRDDRVAPWEATAGATLHALHRGGDDEPKQLLPDGGAPEQSSR